MKIRGFDYRRGRGGVVEGRDGQDGRDGRDGLNGRRRRTDPSIESIASIPSIQSTYPEIAANAALVLIGVACALLDRQIAAQAAVFTAEGGFTERLHRVRTTERRSLPRD